MYPVRKHCLMVATCMHRLFLYTPKKCSTNML